ncbi:PREDICTED: mucin-12-like isoform X2 [Dinoponera quadriceps]|uniref:Mucin-12-like isoform X2 n=1 Tax=Dinoponera quadriceps TaxID=609295 RepID=A0A6P3X418_DINQU|nr:PREDICTED: mucin-12-like isoform X2 [Dinoponera quadriceps]
MRPLCGASLMRSLLLLLISCQLATSTPIFDKDGAGSPGRYRSAGFGESIRDWFRMLKNRIVGKWQEWFADETPAPSFPPQDILNIDKSLERGIKGYPGLLLDLFAGDKYGPDCDTDEWDFKSWLPALPTFPDFDWTNINGFGGSPKSPTTVSPRTESTTIREQTTQTVARTEEPPPVPTTANAVGTTDVSVAESTTESAESTEEISTFNESDVTNGGESTVRPATNESIAAASTTEPIVSAESTTIRVAPSTTESIVTTTGEWESSATSSAETIFTEPDVTSSTPMIIGESTVTPAPGETTTTESPATTFELPLPVVNKRIEDNETIEKPTKRPKPRRSSVEVIM